MKSAGVSLTRIMMPIMLITFLIAGFSFLCSNYIIPVANLKFKTRLYDIKRQKPTLSLQEKVFNYDFAGFTLRIGKKHDDGQTIEDVMIYDHMQDKSGKLILTKADHGKMYMTQDRRGFVMNLTDGHHYTEMKESGNSKYPFIKMDFEEYEKTFDLTQFEISRTDEDQHKSHYTMLSVRQLKTAIDTLNNKIHRAANKNMSLIIPEPQPQKSYIPTNRQRQRMGQQPQTDKLNNPNIPFIETFSSADLNILLKKLKSSLSKTRPNLVREKLAQQNLVLLRARHIYERNFKYAIAIMCFVFLFIGGPMGAIIRKGGYGYPLLVTILFFMLYIVLSITFKETMKVGGMDPLLAAWLPVFILSPIGLVLTIKAMNDSKFLDIDKIAIYLRNFWTQLTNNSPALESS